MNFHLEQDSDFDKDGMALGNQLGVQVFDWDEFQDKLKELKLELGLNMDGAWIVVDKAKNTIATLA